MGVPLHHPFINGFSLINHPYLGTPIYGNPHIVESCSLKPTANCLNLWTREPPCGAPISQLRNDPLPDFPWLLKVSHCEYARTAYDIPAANGFSAFPSGSCLFDFRL